MYLKLFVGDTILQMPLVVSYATRKFRGEGEIARNWMQVRFLDLSLWHRVIFVFVRH